MTIELSEFDKIQVTSPESIYCIMRQILLRENKIDRDVEHMWVIGLSHNQMIQHIELVGLGSMNQLYVKPMEVFRMAVYKGAVKMILCHNHPGPNMQLVDMEPSESDNEVTDQMIQVGKILGIEIIDHLIISTKYFYSYQASGLLKKLEKSNKFVPHYMQIEDLKKEMKEIQKQSLKAGMEKGIKKGRKEGIVEGEKKGAKAEKINMAKKMKQEGEPVDRIVKYTGLSKTEIEKL